MTQYEVVPKTWGRELIYVNSRKYCMKILVLDAGAMSSLHYHKRKDETFLCSEGQVMLEYGSKHSDLHTTILMPGDAKRLAPGVIHRFRALTHGGARIVECSTQHRDNDVVRLEMSQVL